MNILLLEPFYAGSHKSWAESYQHSSQHNVDIFHLKGKYWKWRMHGGAVSLANQYLQSTADYDLILATDMLDLGTFIALSRQKTATIPVALYFHENQLTYPWSPTDKDVELKRDNHYAFINYTSALTANQLFFNSTYHLQSFTEALLPFLKQFPNPQNIETIQTIKDKSQVLHLGMSLKKFDRHQINEQHSVPIILWNHRWEYDKNPIPFFETLFQLADENIPFELVVLGESYQKEPKIFGQAKAKLANRILHYGYADRFEDYAHWLWRSDILPVTSHQDFFGGSIVEAIYCDCIPLLPNRLAYPEHIPKKHHQTFFYEKEDDFYIKLKSFLINYPNRTLKSTQNFVAHYDWSTLAPLYDRMFNELRIQTNEIHNL